jgi:hypothetical protein
MIPYSVQIPQFTLAATTTAFGTVIAATTRALILTELDFQGRGNSSADNEVGLYRVGTAGTTGSSALTFTPKNPASPAFAGTGFAAYSTQPIKGALLHNMPLNANGQRYFWRANPNLNNAIAIPAGNVAAASVTLMPVSGTSSVGGRLELLEI